MDSEKGARAVAAGGRDVPATPGRRRGEGAKMDANILKYQAFVETVRAGTITRAAQSLSYSQSGISRMIADLEQEWGITLLERGRKGVVLTSDGAAILPMAEAICEDYRRLLARVDEVAGVISGSIVIGTFSSVATHVLPPAIQRFQERHPNIGYELRMGDYSEIESWVADGRVDFGFLPYPPQVARPDLAREVILRDDLLAVMPEGHALARRKSVTLEDLCGEPFILLEHGRDNEISPLFERAGLEPHARFSTWDDYAIMSMVESGLGLAILPGLILTRCPYRIEKRPLRPAVTRELAAVYRPGLLSTAARAFLDCLTDVDLAG